MTKLVLLILITLFVSLPNTSSVITTRAYGTSSYDYMVCIFSVIVCLNDQSPQLDEPANEGFIHSAINRVSL
jgi:hypothetical protein